MISRMRLMGAAAVVALLVGFAGPGIAWAEEPPVTKHCNVKVTVDTVVMEKAADGTYTLKFTYTATTDTPNVVVTSTQVDFMATITFTIHDKAAKTKGTVVSTGSVGSSSPQVGNAGGSGPLVFNGISGVGGIDPKSLQKEAKQQADDLATDTDTQKVTGEASKDLTVFILVVASDGSGCSASGSANFSLDELVAAADAAAKKK